MKMIQNQQIDYVMDDAMHLPAKATLKKYGLSLGDWVALYVSHHGCCHVCGRSFVGIRANIDHEHVKGWKQMPPEQRKQHIRGLLCYTCNKFMMMRGVTSDRLLRGHEYLRKWEVRVRFDPKMAELLGSDVENGRPDKPRSAGNQHTHE